MFARFATIVVSGLLACSDAALVKKGAVQMVIEMLEEYKAKIAIDLGAEEKEMAEYARYCDKEASDRGYAIKTATRKMTDLNAVLLDGQAQVSGGNKDISDMGTEMAGKDQDMSALEKQRHKEKTDFEDSEKELSASVEQVDKALVLVKRAGVGLLQKKGSAVPSTKLLKDVASVLSKVVDAASMGDGSSSQALKGFLQQKDGEDLSAALLRRSVEEPAAAEGGGGLVQTLEDMKSKAEEALSAARMNEMKTNNAYQMMKQNIANALATLQEKLGDTRDMVSGVQKAMGEASGELSSVQKAKSADQAFLTSLQSDCQKAAEAWEERQQGAKGEMGAIDKAAAILADRVKVFVQGDDDYVTGEDSGAANMARENLVGHLKELGHRFNSYALAELAGAAAADPFAKVRTLISDMIAKLTAEAESEATQKGFCDEEKAKSSKEKDKKTMRVDQLQNRIDTASSTTAMLKEKAKELQEEIAVIDAASGEASKIRAEEQAINMKTSQEYKEASDAVTAAVRALREYYASVAPAASAASLAQLSKGQQPSFGGAKTDAAAVIIGMLENIGAEFSKLYMEIELEEREAGQAYKTMAAENKAAKAAKLAEVASSESEVKGLKVSVEENGEDLKMVTKELDAVLTYIEKLKPQCETKVMSYEEKRARRTAEIEGLKEALAILDAQ